MKYAAKQDPGARTAAREMGVAVGKQVRYYDGNTERYGVVRAIHVWSVEIELTAGGLLAGGENMVVREDEIPYSGVRKVLGDGRLAVRVAAASAARQVAPERKGGYVGCDFCKSAIYEVLATTRGIKALCKAHSLVSEDETKSPTFKFQLGLIQQTYRAWPVPPQSA